MEMQFVPPAAAAMAAQVVIDAAIAFLQEESERYSASYSGIAVGDAFYDAKGKINLTGIEMRRMLEQEVPRFDPVKDVVDETSVCSAFRKTPKQRPGNVAMSLRFRVEPTRDGTAFLLAPEAVMVDQAKAKIHLFNWFEPWTWFGFGAADSDIDVVVKLTLHAAWVDKDQKGRFEKVAEGEFKIRNLELGTTYKPDPDPAKGEKQLSAGTFEGQLVPAIPRSVPASGGPGGNFVVTILVTEVDDYGSEIKEHADRLQKGRDGLIERVTNWAN
jgi:hypothetical protein